MRKELYPWDFPASSALSSKTTATSGSPRAGPSRVAQPHLTRRSHQGCPSGAWCRATSSPALPPERTYVRPSHLANPSRWDPRRERRPRISAGRTNMNQASRAKQVWPSRTSCSCTRVRGRYRLARRLQPAQKDGYTVSILENSTTLLADDVAVTKRTRPPRRAGASRWPLVGWRRDHEAGNDPKVAGLVYIAAFAPTRASRCLRSSRPRRLAHLSLRSCRRKTGFSSSTGRGSPRPQLSGTRA